MTILLVVFLILIVLVIVALLINAVQANIFIGEQIEVIEGYQKALAEVASEVSKVFDMLLAYKEKYGEIDTGEKGDSAD